MVGRSKDDSSSVGELQRQREPMRRGDNPEGRFRGAAPKTAGRAGEKGGAAQAFSPAELALINAFLALRGYPDARPADEPRDSSREVVVSSPEGERPAIVVGKENGRYSYALFERRGVEKGVMSSGHENIDSLPLILAMIDRPDEF
jgi:hypothetical protein